MNKSTILINELSGEVKTQAASLFPMIISDLEQGVKYIGFLLKPNGYIYEDYIWQYKKLEARILVCLLDGCLKEVN